MGNFKTKILISDKEIIYNELLLKDYKIILKCLLSTPLDISALFFNLNTILTNITYLTEDEINNLNIIEYFLLLAHIRSTSIGNIIFATYNGSEKKINLQIPLNDLINELTTFLENYSPVFFNIANIPITIKLPKIKDFIKNDLYSFIDGLDVEQLPVKIFKQINEHIHNLKNNINNIFFFNPVVEDYNIKFSSNTKDYFSLIKILYNENLMSVYDNILKLCRIGNFSAEYLENCTYGEFKLFVKKIEAQYNNSSTPSESFSTVTAEPEFDPIDIESLYGRSFDVTPSEFTP